MNTDTVIRANRTLRILFGGSDQLSAYRSRIEEMRECPDNNAGLIRERYLKMCNYMKMGRAGTGYAERYKRWKRRDGNLLRKAG